MTEKISNRYLRNEIKRLIKSAKRNRFKGRFGLQKYLIDVFSLHIEWETRGIAQRAARRIAKLLQLSGYNQSHPIRVLINATAGAENAKQKSRWYRALRYALTWPGGPEKLEMCFEVFGGIAGTAGKWPRYQETRQATKSVLTVGSGDPTHARTVPEPSLVAGEANSPVLTYPNAAQ